MAELLSLVVDGYALQGFQAVRISRSVEAAAISFELAATNPAWSSEAGRLRQCKLVEIYTVENGALGAFGGGDLACAGYVDEYAAQVSPGSRRVSVSGRSKAADAIDCEPVRHETGFVENKDLAGVAEEFDEWGVGFEALSSLPAIPMVQRTPGEPLFATLEREARRQGLFLTGQPDGSVQIARGPGPRHAGGLVEGAAPLIRYRLRDQMNVAFSECVVRGQKSEGVEEDDLRQEETASSEAYGRHRPLLIENEGSNESEDLRERAQWELDRRNGARLAVQVTVSTWRDEAGQLWAPRNLLYVDLPSEELATDLAIQAVEFVQELGEGEGCGTFAELTLVLPETLGSAS